jgi:hypothetical protein
MLRPPGQAEKNKMKIILDDRTLFGNDAGEDEKESILISYFVNRPDFTRFLDTTRDLQVVKGRKGTGKSALLVRFAHDRRTDESGPAPIVVHMVPSSLIAIRARPDTDDPHTLENYWKQVICAAINLELAQQIGFAWKDSQMSLVEGADIAGYRGRNLLSSLLARLVRKIDLGAIELAHTPQAPADQQQLLKRVKQEDSLDRPIWFLLDDIDARFQNTPSQRVFVDSFFSASRSLTREVKGIGIRATVRADVWASLASSEDQDKVEQYVTDLTWSASQQESMLVHRIYAYVARNYPGGHEATTLTVERNATELLNLVFTEKWKWGVTTVPAAYALRILAGGRPRWLTQLCRMAGEKAVFEKTERIHRHHAKQSMLKFGQRRLSDLYKEYQYQFSELQALLESFSGGERGYTTADLMTHLTTRYIGGRAPETIPAIDGVQYKEVRQIAKLLFKMGFITGHKPESRIGGTPEFVSFEDRPDLLDVHTNLDDGMTWEIQPAYRDVLNIAS